MRLPVDQAVRRFLADKSLPGARFARLNAIAAQAAPRGRRVTARYSHVVTMIAAGVTVVLVLVQYQTLRPSADVHQHIADEVATNHVKLKTLEVSSSDLSAMRTFFDSLGFELVESALFEKTPWQMLGGRFCTIRGEAAAQLRMRDPRGQVQTVYQVSYDANAHRNVPDVMRGEAPIKLYSHGLEVRLWRERGLLFATAMAQ